MVNKFPGRPASHVLAHAAERFFENALPPAWVKDKPQNDYGVDYRIGIAADVAVSSHAFLVQLKGKASAPAGDYVPVTLSVSTFNYLWNQLEVALIAVYVEEEQEAYWIRLEQVPEPNQDQETFTVLVPRSHRFSAVPWGEIEAYVTHVSRSKLDAMRKIRSAARKADF